MHESAAAVLAAVGGVDTRLAETSNLLVYSAMAVYTLALLAFVVDLSSRGRRFAEASAAREAALAGAAVPVPVGVTAGAAGAPSVAAPAPPTTADAAGGADGPLVPGGRERVRSKAAGIAVSLTWLAFAAHLAGVVSRGVSVQRVPWGNMYEFSITGSVIVTGAYLAVLLRRDLRFLGTFVIGPVLLVLGLAISVLYAQASQLVPALQSYWLVIHVSVAVAASALYTMAFSLTVLQLVQGPRQQAAAEGRPWRLGRFMDAMPGAARLEHLATRLHVVSFPLWSFTVIAGAIWAERAWGRYWNWDPKEVWSLVIWLVYAAHLHAKATPRWSARAVAWIAVAGYLCILFNFLVVNIFFNGLHSYSGV